MFPFWIKRSRPKTVDDKWESDPWGISKALAVVLAWVYVCMTLIAWTGIYAEDHAPTLVEVLRAQYHWLVQLLRRVW